VIHRFVALLFVAALLGACTTTQQTTSEPPSASVAATTSSAPSASEAPAESPSASAAPTAEATPSEPPVGGIYAGPASGVLDPRVAHLPPRVYVPNETSNDVAVIDPETFEIVGRFAAGAAPEHISPDWDFSKLYVSNMNGATLTVIDPETQQSTETMNVPFPYNLFFTPDGSKAIIVADYLGADMVADNGLYFYDRETWQLLKFVQVPWPGVNHLDFTADGRYLMVTCESAGVVVKIDTVEMEIVGTVEVGGSPLDIRLAPDGDVFYVANQGTHGVDVIDAEALAAIAFIPTSSGAHAFAFSRDASRLFVTNRLENTISVIDLATRTVVDTWQAGGSPDMATVSPDGSQLWISNRFHGTVTVFDPETGEQLANIQTGGNPHGLTYWPQPGTISLGHNGNMR
jgi:YVTN family beta-propeller protein